jgi:hypothetical protein
MPRSSGRSETVALRPILPSFSERNVSRWRGLTPFEERI